MSPSKSSLRSHDLTLKPLDDSDPTRLELEWNIPEGHLNDVFFQRHYEAIVANVKVLVEKIFNAGEHPYPQSSVWSQDTGDNDLYLEQIISQIARPEPSDPNPWDDLMKNEAKRFCVMRGVLLKVFADQIFSLYLFGADDEQNQTFRRQDRQFLQDEGFRRSKLHATTVKLLLGHSDGIPPLFWYGVDKLALKILVLMLPVLNWVRRTWPPEAELPDIETIYELVHLNVAYAAWVSIHVQLSASIFQFEWKMPGDRYLPDQIELCSRLRSLSTWETTEREFHEVLQRARNAPPGSAPQAPPPKRLARVMISVVPRLQKFTVVTHVRSGEPIGFRASNLADPQVVYYHGLENDVEDNSLFRSSLLEHSASSKPEHRPSFRKFLQWVIIGACTRIMTMAHRFLLASPLLIFLSFKIIASLAFFLLWFTFFRAWIHSIRLLLPQQQHVAEEPLVAMPRTDGEIVRDISTYVVGA